MHCETTEYGRTAYRTGFGQSCKWGDASVNFVRRMIVRVQKPIAVELPAFGVAVLESHHAEGFAASGLRHAFAKLILVIEGRGSLHACQQQFALERDTLVHVTANVSHRLLDEPGRPVSLYAVCYRPDRARISPQSDVRCWRL